MATPTTLPSTFVAGNVLTAAQMNDLRGAFRVLQVVSTTKTDTFTASSVAAGGTADVTGLTVTITPSSTTSKILIYAVVNGLYEQPGVAAGPGINFQIVRDSTIIGVGDAAGNRARLSASQGSSINSPDYLGNASAYVLDTPATTSVITYKITLVNAVSKNVTHNLYGNRTNADTNVSYFPRTASSIIAMEISA